MTKTRVLRIIGRMNVGGPAVQVAELTRGLNPEEFHTRLLVGNLGKGEVDYLGLKAPDLPVKRIKELGRSLRAAGDAKALVAIVGEIRRFRPHVVHTHTAKAGALGRLAARVGGVPVVVHSFHGHVLRGYFGRPAAEAVRLMESGLARITTALVAVGREVRDELLAAGIGKPEQYTVMPPGVPFRRAPSRREARALLGLPLSSFVVAFVARLTRVKRPDRFIAMARQLTAETTNIVFVVAGGGELFDDMRTAAEPLGSRMRFLGWRSDVETVYAAADVAVLTSDNEGMPVSLIEASLAGTPCVTPDVGSASEVVLHLETGLVTTTAVDDLAAAVEALMADPEGRERMGVAAETRASRLFSTRRLVASTEELYRSLRASAEVGAS